MERDVEDILLVVRVIFFQIELEAERTRIIVMKRQEVAEAEYRLQAEKVKLEIIKLASKRK